MEAKIAHLAKSVSFTELGIYAYVLALAKGRRVVAIYAREYEHWSLDKRRQFSKCCTQMAADGHILFERLTDCYKIELIDLSLQVDQEAEMLADEIMAYWPNKSFRRDACVEIAALKPHGRLVLGAQAVKWHDYFAGKELRVVPTLADFVAKRLFCKDPITRKIKYKIK